MREARKKGKRKKDKGQRLKVQRLWVGGLRRLLNQLPLLLTLGILGTLAHFRHFLLSGGNRNIEVVS